VAVEQEHGSRGEGGQACSTRAARVQARTCSITLKGPDPSYSVRIPSFPITTTTSPDHLTASRHAAFRQARATSHVYSLPKVEELLIELQLAASPLHVARTQWCRVQGAAAAAAAVAEKQQ
jgi:hypothetical protein